MINHLIVSSKYDYSTDVICYYFQQSGENYLRINRDEFDAYHISWDLAQGEFSIGFENEEYRSKFADVKSVFYRAPVFLREKGDRILTLEEQLVRSQWSSFMRNLIVLDEAIWVNNPVSVYRAENKFYQLKIAQDIGMKIPETYLTNDKASVIGLLRRHERVIVKALDTPFFHDADSHQQLFCYTTIVDQAMGENIDIDVAPVIVQECVHPKTDIRVTFIGGKMIPVEITFNGYGLEGDWRKQKDNLRYESIELPKTTQNQLAAIMAKLRLNYGGIDLMKFGDDFFFVEVNPTGEWGWLESSHGINITPHIVDLLKGGGGVYAQEM